MYCWDSACLLDVPRSLLKCGLAGINSAVKVAWLGSVHHRWQGQCPDCAEWNTLNEEAPATVFSQKHDLSSGGRAVEFVELDKPGALPQRQPTGLAEFDRALGGGLVPGSMPPRHECIYAHMSMDVHMCIHLCGCVCMHMCTYR